MQYAVEVSWHGRSAQNIGIIRVPRRTGQTGPAPDVFFIVAGGRLSPTWADEVAWGKLVEMVQTFRANDPRPLAGRSYMRQMRITTEQERRMP